MVATDPMSGAVRVLVGGRDYYESNFNRATQVHWVFWFLFCFFLVFLQSPVSSLVHHCGSLLHLLVASLHIINLFQSTEAIVCKSTCL
jgi:hypothetical protein